MSKIFVTGGILLAQGFKKENILNFFKEYYVARDDCLTMSHNLH